MAKVIINESSGDPSVEYQIGGVIKATIGIDDDDSDVFKIEIGAGALGANDHLVLNSTGVGIGGTPTAELDVTGDAIISGGLRVGFTGTPTADKIELGDANSFWDYNSGTPYISFDSGDFIAYNRTSNFFYLDIGSSEFLRLTSVGLGLGGVDPSVPLHIKRPDSTGVVETLRLDTGNGSTGDGCSIDFSMGASTHQAARIAGVLGSGADLGSIRFYVGDGASGYSEALRIEEDRGIYFYNLLAAAASTDVNIDGSNELHSVTSSRRWKENEQTFDLDISKFKNLNPCSWTYRDSSMKVLTKNKKGEEYLKTVEVKHGNKGETDRGLIAEDLYSIYPELVNLDAEGLPYSWKTQSMVSLLVAKIQELENRILTLETS